MTYKYYNTASSLSLLLRAPKGPYSQMLQQGYFVGSEIAFLLVVKLSGIFAVFERVGSHNEINNQT